MMRKFILLDKQAYSSHAPRRSAFHCSSLQEESVPKEMNTRDSWPQHKLRLPAPPHSSRDTDHRLMLHLTHKSTLKQRQNAHRKLPHIKPLSRKRNSNGTALSKKSVCSNCRSLCAHSTSILSLAKLVAHGWPMILMLKQLKRSSSPTLSKTERLVLLETRVVPPLSGCPVTGSSTSRPRSMQ
jgi:hypothetical protein